jgi:hypothetical protein
MTSRGLPIASASWPSKLIGCTLARRASSEVALFRRTDWPSRDSICHLSTCHLSTCHLSTLSNDLVIRPRGLDGLPIRGQILGKCRVSCGWANPSYDTLQKCATSKLARRASVFATALRTLASSATSCKHYGERHLVSLARASG